MIFAIYAYRADTCGNSDRSLVGYYEADTKIEAEQVFPRGVFTGFRVYPVIPSTEESLKREASKIR